MSTTSEVIISDDTGKPTYDDIMLGVYEALPNRGDLPFQTGARGHAARDLAHSLILARVPGLNVTSEINSASERLISSYHEVAHVNGGVGNLGEEDVAAISDYIENYLGPVAKHEGKTYTMSEIKQEAIANHYPNLEKMGLQFSEAHPKPFRSSLIMPLLLQRVEGIDASEQKFEAEDKLEAGYRDVPKNDRTTVSDNEAAHIAKIAGKKRNPLLLRYWALKLNINFT